MPRRAARARDTVDFPDPAGPSMAMVGSGRIRVPAPVIGDPPWPTGPG